MPNCDSLWKRGGGVLEDCLYILSNSRKMQVLLKKRGRILKDSLFFLLGIKKINKSVSQLIVQRRVTMHQYGLQYLSILISPINCSFS